MMHSPGGKDAPALPHLASNGCLSPHKQDWQDQLGVVSIRAVRPPPHINKPTNPPTAHTLYKSAALMQRSDNI